MILSSSHVDGPIDAMIFVLFIIFCMADKNKDLLNCKEESPIFNGKM